MRPGQAVVLMLGSSRGPRRLARRALAPAILAAGTDAPASAGAEFVRE
jgi:hypothetical protein